MKASRDEFRLRDAFAPMPIELSDCIEEAFERGERAMKRRRKIVAVLSAAAVVSVAFAAVALAGKSLYTPVPDNVAAAPMQTIKMLTAIDEPAPESAYETETNEENELIFARNTPEPTPEPLPFEEKEVENERLAFLISLEEIDKTDQDSLRQILNLAASEYVRQGGVEPAADAIEITEASLKEIGVSYYGSTAAWKEEVRQCLLGEMGFTEAFIEEGFLVNHVLACLCVRQVEEFYEFEEISIMDAELAFDESMDG